MKIIVKQGENGYDILTPYCVPFDLADVEVWLYLSVDRSVADLLVRGFSIFWEESGLADGQDDDSEKLAEKHRVDALQKLAKLDLSHLSVDAPNPFHELLQQREEVAEGGPHKTPADNFFTGTELEEWTKELQQKKRRKLLKSLEVPFAEWSKTACTFFDLLHQQPANRHVPSALQGNVKQRRQRTGELPDERGVRLVQQSELEPFFSRSDANCIQWGPLFYKTEQVNDSHFCVAGMSQMGKTTLLRLLFQSLYRQPAEQTRFVLYDAKADLLPVIYPPAYFDVQRTQEEIDSEFYLLTPLDQRCTAWDIAQDASDDDDATDVAELLFPHESNSPVEKHYTRMSRNIAVAAMEALRLKAKGPNWTFYDLLCALQMENLETVLDTTQRGKNAYAKYLAGSEKSNNEAFISLANKTEHLLSAANKWRKSKRTPLSLRAWARGDSKSIVLMSHEKNATALTDINRLLLGMLCRNLFSDQENSIRTFFYLDEFEQLGRIDSIIKAAQQGATKRVNIAMCFHNIELLTRAYGAETDGLLSMCGFFAFLKNEGTKTANWASDYLGNLEKERLSRTTLYSDEEDASNRHSTTASRQSLPNVLPDEIKGLPTPKTSNQVTGYFIAPSHPRYRGCLPLRDLYPQSAANSKDLNSLWPASPRVKDFIGPSEALTIPADTFFTLHQLGFHKDGYKPPEEEPDPDPEAKPVDQKPVVAKEQEAAEKTATEKKRVRKRTDVTFDFGLDD